MDPNRLKELLENPESVTSEDVPELESLVSTYPYFQAAKVLLAKVTGTSEAIKSAAAITADRTLLMRVISGTFDKDVNLPNLNDLDIGDEVNAFDHLNEEEQEEAVEENQYDFSNEDESFGENASDEESSKEDSYDENIDALLKSFEDEADEEEGSSEASTQEETTQEATENEKESDAENAFFRDRALSDFSTDDYKLPDYNYNFESDKRDSEEVDSDVTEETSELGWEKETESNPQENTFEDFDLKDISEDSDEQQKSEEAVTSDEEDIFRNELMESLADLERIRKENASHDEKIEESKVPSPDDELIVKEVNDTESISETEATEEPQLYADVETQKNEEEDTQKHVIENIKKTETTSDNNPMFDDNLFELNHLIDGGKQDAGRKQQEAGTNGQKDMIDRFINTIPELTAQDHEGREYSHLARDLYDKSIHADTSKMTETMAKLMITQGKLPRAIEIYEHLMLKYPEKKAYFASLIEKIRKDI